MLFPHTKPLFATLIARFDNETVTISTLKNCFWCTSDSKDARFFERRPCSHKASNFENIRLFKIPIQTRKECIHVKVLRI